MSTAPNQAMLYTVDAAIALIGTTSGFAPGWSKDTAEQALRTAFEWAEAEADTNFPRKRVVVFARQRAEAEGKLRRSRAAAERRSRRNSTACIRANAAWTRRGNAYDEMARSGLFSDAELAAPSKTGAMAEEHLQLAETRLEEHQRRVAAETILYARWNAFLSETAGRPNPGSLADEIEAAKRTATDALEQARRNQKDAERSATASPRTCKLRQDVCSNPQMP